VHDISLIEPLCDKLEKIAREKNAIKVIRVVLEVGEDFDLSPDHFQETYMLLSSKTPLLREAQMEFHKVPGIHGHEMLLRDVELEVNDE